MTEYLVIGQVGKTHGVWGEVHVRVLTDFPERIKRGVMVYLGEEHRPTRIRNCRGHEKTLLIAFEGYGVCEEAENLRGEMIYVRADDRPALEEGEYYQHQIIGLRVFSDDAQAGAPALGVVSDILETGANDVLVIETENGKEVLLPMLEDTILNVDLSAGELKVHLLPGLI